MEQAANVQEASIVGEVARSIPRINLILDDNHAEYQTTMVELEGNISRHSVSILVYLGVSLSYISPKLVETVIYKWLNLEILGW